MRLDATTIASIPPATPADFDKDSKSIYNLSKLMPANNKHVSQLNDRFQTWLRNAIPKMKAKTPEVPNDRTNSRMPVGALINSGLWKPNEIPNHVYLNLHYEACKAMVSCVAYALQSVTM